MLFITSSAEKHFLKALEIQPHDPEIEYILSSISENEEKPNHAPKEYLQHLFDEYAPHFDKHLTEFLKYETPKNIAKAITEELGTEKDELTILDLGCGTGLAGNELQPLAKNLIGIDISEKMIEAANQKEIYDKLEVMDINQALKHYTNNDLIIATDVFTYVGDLTEIFKKLLQHGFVLLNLVPVFRGKEYFQLFYSRLHKFSIFYLVNPLTLAHNPLMALRFGMIA